MNQFSYVVSTLAKYGLAKYPDEWWHFSYGDRLYWAEVTGPTLAFFAPIDYDSKDWVILPQANTTDIF